MHMSKNLEPWAKELILLVPSFYSIIFNMPTTYLNACLLTKQDLLVVLTESAFMNFQTPLIQCWR